MKCGARVAVGVAGGYFLGRTKKMKLALMLGGMAAGSKVGGPGALLSQGARLAGSSPELQALRDQVRGRLMDAGKDLVSSIATRQIEALSGRLTDRVENLGGGAGGTVSGTSRAARGAASDAASDAAQAVPRPRRGSRRVRDLEPEDVDEFDDAPGAGEHDEEDDVEDDRPATGRNSRSSGTGASAAKRSSGSSRSSSRAASGSSRSAGSSGSATAKKSGTTGRTGSTARKATSETANRARRTTNRNSA